MMFCKWKLSDRPHQSGWAASTTTQNGGEKSIEYCQLKAATLAGKCQKVFVTAFFAFHAGKPFVDVVTIQIPINHPLDKRPPEAVQII